MKQKYALGQWGAQRVCLSTLHKNWIGICIGAGGRLQTSISISADIETGIGINNQVDISIGIITCTIWVCISDVIIVRIGISMGISIGVLVSILKKYCR